MRLIVCTIVLTITPSVISTLKGRRAWAMESRLSSIENTG